MNVGRNANYGNISPLSNSPRLLMTDPAEKSPPDARSSSKREPGAEERRPAERGGPKGPEPTRYGDWEKKGRCIDF
jgi:hypothetical protein